MEAMHRNQSMLQSRVRTALLFSLEISEVLNAFFLQGDIFDVTHKADSYGPGKSYNIFAGKDGSRGLGKSSLKVEDAVADYSTLGAPEKKVLDDWHSFFSCVYFLSDVRSFFRDFSFSLFFSENVTILSEKFLMVQILSHRRQIKLLGFPRLLDGVVAFNALFVMNAGPNLQITHVPVPQSGIL